MSHEAAVLYAYQLESRQIRKKCLRTTPLYVLEQLYKQVSVTSEKSESKEWLRGSYVAAALGNSAKLVTQHFSPLLSSVLVSGKHS